MIIESNDLIVKSNSLVEASYSLSVVEFRLLQMVFAEISQYESSEGLWFDKEFRIHANEYAKTFGVDSNTSYQALKDAGKRLFNRYFTYEIVHIKPDFIELVESRWVQKVIYSKSNGYITLVLTDDVKKMVGKLKDCFTKYKIKQISNLTSIYALRLYELLIQWESKRKTPVFEINDFRNKLGVAKNEYSRMFDFKKYVLDFSVKQINLNTNLHVEVMQHKKGRVIQGFSFTFVEITEEKDTKTVDWVDEEVKKPKRKKISEDDAVAMAKPGETWEELLKRLTKDFHVIFNK